MSPHSVSRPKVGYLLPTREAVMAGRPETGPLLALAERAETLGYDSLWVGDSLLARPRHEPLTLLAAVAARTQRAQLGTAVLLPALRPPVVLAHLCATVDRISEGRLILGVGIAPDTPGVRAEFAAAGVPFEQRVGRMVESLDLCRKLWSGETVDHYGRYYTVESGLLGPTPHQLGGPPIWAAGTAPAALRRIANRYDGWFPIGPDAEGFASNWDTLRQQAAVAGRSDALTAAIYLTLSVDDDGAKAEAALNNFLESYYSAPANALRRFQACFAGPLDAARRWIAEFVAAGATHLVLRFAGDHERHLDLLAGLAEELPPNY